MSDSLLTLPTQNEATVVERFTEASKELIPGMQISLARRIVRPGSDQVLCLNATTSVPMQDDEIASVSDLALKLSDGTNVRISLSFFNDGNECPAFNHSNQFQTSTTPASPKQFSSRRSTTYTFDPERYSMHSVNNESHGNSGVTSAMLIATTIAILGLGASFNGPASYTALFAKLKQSTTKTSPITKPLLEAGKAKVAGHSTAPAVVPQTPKVVNGDEASITMHSKSNKVSKPAPVITISAPKSLPKQHHGSSKLGISQTPLSMMVPPPPVTYNFTPAQLFTPAEIAAMQPAPASAKTSINSTSRNQKIGHEQQQQQQQLQQMAPEKPKVKDSTLSSIPEFDDENTSAPNSGLDMFPPMNGER